MRNPSYITKIKNRISVAEYGSVFVAADFADITEKTIANVILTRISFLLMETSLLLKELLTRRVEIAYRILRFLKICHP